MSDQASASSFAGRMAVKLKELLIKEVSAVDEGAHQSDGWVVMKSAAASDLKLTPVEESIFFKQSGSAHTASITAADPDELAKAAAAGDLTAAEALRILFPDDDEFVKAVRAAVP